MDVPTMWSGEEKIADVKSSIGLRLMRHNGGFDFGKLRQEPLIPACTQHCRQSVRMCRAPHQQSVRTLSVQSKTYCPIFRPGAEILPTNRTCWLLGMAAVRVMLTLRVTLCTAHWRGSITRYVQIQCVRTIHLILSSKDELI